eukprot:scaffold9250_cov105-Isochrysis_galbana.AAC.1
MAKDVEQRTAKRKAEVAAAGVEKERGNAAFKANQYGEALAAYSRAIEHHRGDKAVYANRALAHIKLRNFLSAVEVRAWAQGPEEPLGWAMAQVHRLGGVMRLFSICFRPPRLPRREPRWDPIRQHGQLGARCTASVVGDHSLALAPLSLQGSPPHVRTRSPTR